MVAVVHQVCGEVAMFYSHRPELGEALIAADATLLNGEKPKDGDMAVCGHCGVMLSWHADAIEFKDHDIGPL